MFLRPWFRNACRKRWLSIVTTTSLVYGEATVTCNEPPELTFIRTVQSSASCAAVVKCPRSGHFNRWHNRRQRRGRRKKAGDWHCCRLRRRWRVGLHCDVHACLQRRGWEKERCTRDAQGIRKGCTRDRQGMHKGRCGMVCVRARGSCLWVFFGLKFCLCQ